VSSPALRELRGKALPLRGHDIDTDRIIPARFLKRVSFEGLEAHVFEDDRAAEERAGRVHPFSNPSHEGASVLLAGRNFGCGSSREHAPQALKRWGIVAVIGESFSEIFFGNSLALGLPCLTADAGDLTALASLAAQAPDTRFVVDVAGLRVTAGDRVARLSMPKGAHQALVSGTWDATQMLLEDFEEVAAVAARLPYIRAFDI
jgi:3-isopropylmalate/(R)-2-methylmalate dehydratase small subunit